MAPRASCVTRLWNHFSIDATYYHSNTYNQTFNITLASSSGYSSAIVQTGNIQNYGLELALGYNNTWRDFSWNSSLTYTMNRNKVTLFRFFARWLMKMQKLDVFG